MGPYSKFSFFAVLGLLPGLPASAQSGLEVHKYFECQDGGDIRTVTVLTSKSGGGGCRVDYARNGKSKTIWSARADDTFCTPKAEALVISLKSSNHQCEDRTDLKTKVAVDASSLSRSESLDTDQRRAALTWTAAQVEAVVKKNSDLLATGAAKFPTTPSKMISADVDGDGLHDVVLQWGWTHYQCDDDYLAVLIKSGGADSKDSRSKQVSAQVFLPSDCGRAGWRSTLDRFEAGRIYVKLVPRARNLKDTREISATVDHSGRFKFYDPAGHPRDLDAIVEALNRGG